MRKEAVVNAKPSQSRMSFDISGLVSRVWTRALQSSSSVRFEVRIDGGPHDQFYDLRDAAASARIAKQKNPVSIVVVIDVTTGKLMIEVEA